MPGNELEVLNHYKRKIEKNLENEEILLRSLAKLDGVRVNIALLQDTGIGRTVSLLKKQYADQDIGTKSRDLVTKWKDVVAREEDVSEESAEDKEEGASATGDEEVETKGHGSPPSYTPTPKAAAYVPTPLSGYVPTPLAELKHESKGSENHNLDEHYENEEHNGTNGHVETEVTQRNGNEEESDKEQHKKSKKHKKDKEREKDRKDRHRNDDDKEKSKKRKSSHRDHSEEESEQIKTEIKSETIKKETISHSLVKKEKTDKEERTEGKGEKHSHEDKKDKYGSREDKRDKKDKHTKEKENKEKSREHKSSNGEHKSRHEKSNGEHSKSNGEHPKSSSSKHSESRDREKEKEKEKERKIKSEKDVQEGKSHKDKHREKDRTKDDSDRKHSSSKSKDRPKSDVEESHDRSEKQRLKDKKKKSESAAMAGFDMFANMGGGGDKKHKKRPREDSTEEIADKTEDAYKPTSKQSRVDSGVAIENGFSAAMDHKKLDSAAMDHKKFKLPTPPRIDTTTLSGPSFIPDISPHYKPLPRAPPPPNNHRVDEGVTLDALISGRNKRQQAVYSGAKRGGYRGEVPSLKDQCIQKLKDNVDDIYECGGLSFDVLEPILIRASAETLMQIELYNPYLMEDTSNIWEGFCKKEFRNKKRNAEDLESWREMYERCIREREEKLQQLKNKVSKNFNARGEAKDSAARQTKMAFVDQVSKPPREVRAQQAKNGTALPVGHSFKPGAGNAKVGMRNSDPTRGSSGVMTSKKPKTAPMMAKVRRMMRR